MSDGLCIWSNITLARKYIKYWLIFNMQRSLNSPRQRPIQAAKSCSGWSAFWIHPQWNYFIKKQRLNVDSFGALINSIYPVKNGHYCFWQVPKGFVWRTHYQRQKHETDFLSFYSSTIFKLQGCFLIASSMDWCAGIEGRVSPVPKSLVLSFSTQPSLPRAFIDHILSIVANHIQLN